MATTWQQLVNWSTPLSIETLTSKRGARLVIPKDYGYYVFLQANRAPSPDICLYLGIAARQTLYRRLGSYLRRSVTASKAEKLKHRGKRLITFARIRGVDGAGSASATNSENDRKIFVAWAVSPLELDGQLAANSIEAAYMLERAMVSYYRPVFNTADWHRENDFDLEDELDWEWES